jgi:hypothetical protein
MKKIVTKKKKNPKRVDKYILYGGFILERGKDNRKTRRRVTRQV